MRQHALELSGLELLQRAIAGEFPPPPIAKLMDIRLTEVARPRDLHRHAAGIPLQPARQRARRLRRDAARLGDGLRRAQHARSRRHLHDARIQDQFPARVDARDRPGARIGTVINETRTTALAEGRIEDARAALCLRHDDVRNPDPRKRSCSLLSPLACWHLAVDLLLHVPLQLARPDFGAVDVAGASTATPSAASVPVAPARPSAFFATACRPPSTKVIAVAATDRE